MDYIKETGIIYDCIYYGVQHFDGSSDNNFYNMIKKRGVCPPKYLHPFFYYDIIASPLSEYFRYNIFNSNYYINGIEDFINLLNNNAKKFKDFIIDYTLSELRETEKQLIKNEPYNIKLFSALEEMSYDDYWVVAYNLLITNFETYTTELIDFLKKIYPHISELHNQFEDHINECYLSLNTNLTLKGICNSDDIKTNSYLNADVAICLINKYVNLISKDQNKVFLMLGISHKDCLEDSVIYKHITAKSFNYALGNNIRYRIFEKLSEPGSMFTAKQLSEILNISFLSVKKHIDILYNELILKTKQTDSSDIFYLLNKSYFNHLYPKIMDFFDFYNIKKDLSLFEEGEFY